MKQGWVIFRLSYDTKPSAEIYVHAEQGNGPLLEITDSIDSAMQFASAREAYDWARMRRLDWWRVGAR